VVDASVEMVQREVSEALVVAGDLARHRWIEGKDTVSRLGVCEGECLQGRGIRAELAQPFATHASGAAFGSH
jgi:hypothetical protein